MPPEILIHEHTPIICNLTRKAFQRRGIGATHTDNHLKMICLWLEQIRQRNPFSMIFIDGNMPFPLITDVIASIRSIEQKMPPKFRVPPVRIIATTTRPWFGKEDGRKLGIDDVVLKPAHYQEWEKLIRSQPRWSSLDLAGS